MVEKSGDHKGREEKEGRGGKLLKSPLLVDNSTFANGMCDLEHIGKFTGAIRRIADRKGGLPCTITPDEVYRELQDASKVDPRR